MLFRSEDTRSILEPAGALGVAAIKQYAHARGAKGETYVAITCGANMNFDRLRFVAERAELGEHREAVLGVTIPEKPGSFRALCELLGKRSVTEFNYRFADTREAHVFLGITVSGREETDRLIVRLRFFDGQLLHQIAGQVHLSYDQVRDRYQKALRRLRGALKELQ